MSEYYTSPTDVIAGTRARSITVNNLDAAIDDAFDALPAGLVATTAEIVAARDGFASLLLKQDDQDTRIAALGGDTISLNLLSQQTMKEHFLL